MPRWVLLLAVTLVLPGRAQQPSPFGVRLDGPTLTSLAPAGTKAVVLFFVASDCPISNRTFPEMKRVREEFAPRGIRFWFVYPNQMERPEQIRQHQAVYDAGGDTLLDPAGALVRLAGARVTPEVSVLVPAHRPGGSNAPPAWRPVYTGRIDDRYLSLGHERPQATAHFAERTLAAVLAAAPVAPPTGASVGCAIIGSVGTPPR